jgi:hypothetical protein
MRERGIAAVETGMGWTWLRLEQRSGDLAEAVVAPWKTLFFSVGSEEVLVGARVFAAAVGTSGRTELGRK